MARNDGAGPLGSSEPVGLRHRYVQELRKVLRKRREREESGCFGIEGPGLVLDALASDLTVRRVFIGETATSSEVASAAAGLAVEVVVVNDRGIEAIGATVSPSPFYALAELPRHTISATVEADVPFVLVLANVADPGNAGTLIRTAEACGASGVVLAGDSAVDPFGPKCVRSSAGSVFRLPVAVDKDFGRVVGELKASGVRCFGATLGGVVPFTDLDLTSASALVLGNEAHGLNAAQTALLDHEVIIPMAGRVESLNVAMAGTLLAYEVFRQRK